MRSALALSAFALSLLPANLVAAPPAEKAKSVDIVLCLDTSNSMDGLVDSAKRKLWVVVNDVAKLQPTPELRVGLYSYGNNTYDAKRGWVRLEVPLTTDLDEVYKRINVLKCAAPGSDEFVARVTRDALAELKWSDDKDALRMIFVCGNEPVDQDKEVSLESVAATAKSKGVVINTIYCGPASHAEVIGWCNFATSTGGKYANIDQDRAKAEIAIKTPFDEEIQKLGTKINETYVWYGMKGAGGRDNQAAQDANAAKTAPGVAVERSVTKASAFYKNAECDLIDKMLADKKFDLKQLKEEDLPAELKKLKPDEREAYLKKKAEDRAEIQKKVAELSARRALYMEEERAKQPKSAGDQALDGALRSILREQAA
ncbi:MAG TPA: vWA domain-containing protein, partial [Gemmataceae bacterium]|nr:vWA domain-containing protein [Gemmataceae bacterium]